MKETSRYSIYRKYCRLLLLFLWVTCYQQAVAQDDYTADTSVSVEEPEDSYFVAPDTPVFRKVPDSIVAGLKKDKAFAYANDKSYWTEEKKAEADSAYKKDFWDYFYEFFANRTVRNIMYGLIALVFAFVLYRILIQNNLFYSNKKVRKADDETEIAEEHENIDESIRKAIEANNRRAATRFLYIKALQLLNNKGWIRYHAQATNHEYVLQMSANKLTREFNFLTEVYDYVWYGEFDLTNEQFDLVQTNFRNFFSAIR